MGKRITTEQKQMVVNMLIHGYSEYAIKENAGISSFSIRKIMKEHGISHDMRFGRSCDIKTTKEEVRAAHTIYSIIMGV